MADVAPPLSLRIAVLTYRRPQDLADVLPQLTRQAQLVTDDQLRADVLVVDNDPDASARPLVEEFRSSEPGVEVSYAHETIPGISAARNRALSSAEDVDLLVFIDDDERPSEDWLPALVRTWRLHRSAAVVGPVISSFSEPPEPWIAEGRFFDRRRLATGTGLTVAATNNLLLDLHVVRRLGLRFDLAFGISGGGDTLFTRTLHRRGEQLVWCDEAIVFDVVPPSRLTRGWVLRRALRSGNSWSATSLELADSGVGRALLRVSLTGSAVVRVLGGAARAVAGLLRRDLGLRARGARTVARGLGMASGAWGWSYREYARPAARSDTP